MKCASCNADNDDGADTCFTCGQPLSAVIRRGTVIASRYEVLNPLGRGGMGVVYKAFDRELEELVAIKVLRSDLARENEMARRFRSEIRLARKVRHPNVCGIHEYGQDGTLRFIAMELIEGTDLKHELRTRGALPPDEAFRVTIQLADGLEAVHDVGIIHRDLKTPNIMRDARGVVRLMDFGIAKQFGSGATSGATATGHIVGTPEYMSPEQARGLSIDTRSDIYALGIVIYEIFTGDVPFRGDTPLATLFMHIQDPPPLAGPKAERLPPALVPIIGRALAKSPDERYATAREVAAALRRTFEESRTTLRVPVTAVPFTPPSMELPVVVPAPMALPQPLATPASRPALAATEVVPTPPTRPAPRATTPRPATPPVRRVERPAMPVPRARRGWLGPSVAVALGGAALAGGWLLAQALSGGSAPSPAPTAAPLSSIEASARFAAPQSTPTPAPPSPTARALPPTTLSSRRAVGPTSPATPATLSSAPPARVEPPSPLPRAPLTPITPPPAAIEARAPAAAEVSEQRSDQAPTAADAAGFLQIGVRPFAEVTLDGTNIGTTPIRAVTLPAGVHTVRLTHPDYRPLVRKVTIRAGETKKLTVDFGLDGIPK